MKTRLEMLKIHFLMPKMDISHKPIGARQGILTKHKQNPCKNGVGQTADGKYVGFFVHSSSFD